MRRRKYTQRANAVDPSPPKSYPAPSSRHDNSSIPASAGGSTPRANASRHNHESDQSLDSVKVAAASLQFPVANAARSWERAHSAMGQYDAMIDLIEALTAVLGITTAGALRANAPTEGKLASLLSFYTRTGATQGAWRPVIELFYRTANDDPEFLVNVSNQASGKLLDCNILGDLDRLRQERNSFAHGGRPRDKHEAPERVEAMSPLVQKVVAYSKFLVDLPWVLTKSSSYNKPESIFSVFGERAMGDNQAFAKIEFTSHIPLSDDSFFALTPGGPIELSPMLAYRYCPRCRKEEMRMAGKLLRGAGEVETRSFVCGERTLDKKLADDLAKLISS